MNNLPFLVGTMKSSHNFSHIFCSSHQGSISATSYNTISVPSTSIFINTKSLLEHCRMLPIPLPWFTSSCAGSAFLCQWFVHPKMSPPIWLAAAFWLLITITFNTTTHYTPHHIAFIHHLHLTGIAIITKNTKIAKTTSQSLAQIQFTSFFNIFIQKILVRIMKRNRISLGAANTSTGSAMDVETLPCISIIYIYSRAWCQWLKVFIV